MDDRHSDKILNVILKKKLKTKNSVVINVKIFKNNLKIYGTFHLITLILTDNFVQQDIQLFSTSTEVMPVLEAENIPQEPQQVIRGQNIPQEPQHLNEGSNFPQEPQQAVTEDFSICIICLTARANCAVVPCGHRSFCEECLRLVNYSHLNGCPICNNEILMIIRIY